jgi:hypothetical protein
MQADQRPEEVPNHPDWEYVTTLGGPTVVGRLCEITPQAVSQWRKTGIPRTQRKYLVLLRPDVFTPDADAPTTQPGALDEVQPV